MKVVIIGNKPFRHFDMSPIIDEEFDQNIRCNMSMPKKKNGTKSDILALCNHLYEHLILRPKNVSELCKIYSHSYKEDEIKKFHEEFKDNNYNSIFYADASSNFNDILRLISCPHLFSKQPRTGYVVMMKSIAGKKTTYITHFSVDPEEKRESYYVQPHHYESNCHSKEDEIKIIHWLHKHNYIDASLCLLKDKESPTFTLKYLTPTIEVLKMVCNVYGYCFLQDYPSDFNTQNLEEVFYITKQERGLKLENKNEKKN